MAEMHRTALPYYPHLLSDFLQAMDDIGRYGEQKYAEKSFQHQVRNGVVERDMDRKQVGAILEHSMDHTAAYAEGEKHDHFGTLKHQLAAGAFNLMMEFHYAKLAELEPDAGVVRDTDSSPS